MGSGEPVLVRVHSECLTRAGPNYFAELAPIEHTPDVYLRRSRTRDLIDWHRRLGKLLRATDPAAADAEEKAARDYEEKSLAESRSAVARRPDDVAMHEVHAIVCLDSALLLERAGDFARSEQLCREGLTSVAYLLKRAPRRTQYLRSAMNLSIQRGKLLSGPLSKIESQVYFFGAAVFGVALLEFLLGQIDKVLIGVYINAREVGIYAVAMAIVTFVPVALKSVNQIFSPTIADLHTRGEHDLLARLFQTLTKWVLGLTLPLAMVVMVFSKPLMQTFGRMRLDVDNCVRELVAFGLVQKAGPSAHPKFSFQPPESDALGELLEDFFQSRATVTHEDRSPSVQRFREMGFEVDPKG